MYDMHTDAERLWSLQESNVTCFSLLLPVYIECYNTIQFCFVLFFPFLKCVGVFWASSIEADGASEEEPSPWPLTLLLGLEAGMTTAP